MTGGMRMKTAGMKCSAFRLRAFKYAYVSGRGKFLNPVDRIEPLARAALVLMGWIFKVWVGWLIYGNIPHSSKYKNVIFMNNTSQGLLVTVNLVNME